MTAPDLYAMYHISARGNFNYLYFTKMLRNRFLRPLLQINVPPYFKFVVFPFLSSVTSTGGRKTPQWGGGGDRGFRSLAIVGFFFAPMSRLFFLQIISATILRNKIVKILFFISNLSFPKKVEVISENKFSCNVKCCLYGD